MLFWQKQNEAKQEQKEEEKKSGNSTDTDGIQTLEAEIRTVLHVRSWYFSIYPELNHR